MNICFKFLTLLLASTANSPEEKPISKASDSVFHSTTPAQKAIIKSSNSETPDDAPSQRVFKPGGTTPKRPIAPRKLALEEILDEGAVIVLTDGSRWRVAKDDVDYTSGWLGPAEVKIKKEDLSGGTYMYFMTNKWTNKTVEVIPIH